MSSTPQNTLERALTILKQCAVNPDGCTFTALREACGGVAATTLTRVLDPLMAQNQVEKSPVTGRYHCGTEMLAVARMALGQASLEDRLMPYITQLSDTLDQPAAYFHWDGEWLYLRLKHERAENFQYAAIGHRTHPPTHTFLQPIMAYLDKPAFERLKITTQGDAMDHVREHGYFSQVETLRFTMFRVAAPVFYGPDGIIAGSVGITSLVTNYKQNEISILAKAVCECAHRCTESLANMEFTP